MKSSRWISTEKELPDFGKDVLFVVTGRQFIEMGHRRETYWESVETAPQDEPIHFDNEQVSHWQALPELPRTAAPIRKGVPVPLPDTRTIQEVLRLHIGSSESMRQTFKNVGDKHGEALQEGITAGLERAIEVADYMDAES